MGRLAAVLILFLKPLYSLLVNFPFNSAIKYAWLIVLSFCLSVASCRIFRPLVYNVPDEKDGKRFPYRVVHSSDSNLVFHFKEPMDTLPEIRKIKVDNRSINSTGVNLNDFVKLHRTLSFLIIRNDSILYQYYAKDLSRETRVSSFSISKAYVAMLVGIAIQDKLIKGVDQPITDFISEWRGRKGYNLITIKNLLRHTSGLKFTTSMTNVLSDQSQFYYMGGLRQRVLNAQIEEEPNRHFKYQSENTCLLDLILERVTHKTLSAYLEEKIWKPIGTEAPAFWSIDSEDSTAIEKSFCCLNARTVDYAKFSRLLLRKGNWNGKQLIPENWIKEATTSTTDNGGKISYGYGMGLGPKAYGSFFPAGLFGQFLYVYPKKNVIIVRFGNSTVPYVPDYWKEVMLQIVDQL